MKKHCPYCGGTIQKWGRTQAGTLRFFCPSCKKTLTKERKDIVERALRQQLDMWLGGKDSLREIAAYYHTTRQSLWRKFHPLFKFAFEPKIPLEPMRMLILDGTYIHGRYLCTLVAIDENDRVFWRFASYESYETWFKFLMNFPEPQVVVMDGQKGLYAAAKALWPEVKIQRCQFHVVSFVLQYLGKHPKDEAGKSILDLLYRLKAVKTPAERDKWIMLHTIWEKQYAKEFMARNESGAFQHQRLRSVRYIMRRALPNLFTYIDNPGTPNTTNLVEGWVNTAIAESLRRHRGLKEYEKKYMVSVVLSHLSRGEKKELVNAGIEPVFLVEGVGSQVAP